MTSARSGWPGELPRESSRPVPALPTDRALDALVPAWARAPSRKHWTPVRAAYLAAHWLVERPGARILDVGSGIGKFCWVGALTTRGVFTGIEQRAHLVEVARKAARRLGVRRCRFIHGNMIDVDWSVYDGYYLYNPFAEQLEGFGLLDRTLEISDARFREYVRFVRRRLREARKATRLVTYHGYGEPPPRGWTQLERDWVRGGPLELWVKTGR
jgi:hypothetical protein